MEWLVDNQNRIEERLKYYCIEQWNCGDIYHRALGGIMWIKIILFQNGMVAKIKVIVQYFFESVG